MGRATARASRLRASPRRPESAGAAAGGTGYRPVGRWPALPHPLVAEGAESGAARADVPAGELAAYCLHSLGAAAGLPSKAAVRRLVAVTAAGLRPAAHNMDEAPAGAGEEPAGAGEEPDGEHGRRHDGRRHGH
ncbi:hypothetical protein [Streptomyces tritici]|uniref:hypothetical protein n=1 Tax=Streptomyces tritici TaxID=2054410 RepID=UPI003AEF7C79